MVFVVKSLRTIGLSDGWKENHDESMRLSICHYIIKQFSKHILTTKASLISRLLYQPVCFILLNYFAISQSQQITN